MFIRVPSFLIGPPQREPTVQKSQTQALDVGVSHFHPGEMTAGAGLSRGSDGMVRIRSAQLSPLQMLVGEQLRLRPVRIHHLHRKDMLTVQHLLQRYSIVFIEQPIGFVHMSGNRYSIRRVNSIHNFHERSLSNAPAFPGSSPVFDTPSKSVNVRGVLRGIENGQNMNTTVDGYLNTGKQVEFSIALRLITPQFRQRIFETINPCPGVVIGNGNTVNFSRHKVQEPFLR